MNQKIKSIGFVFGLITLMFISACNRDLDKIKLPTYSPTIAIPMLQTSLSMSDIIKEGENIIFNADSAISMIYVQDSLISVVVADLVEIPSQEPMSENYILGEMSIDNFTILDGIILNDLMTSIPQAVQDILNDGAGNVAYFPPFASDSPSVIDMPPIEDIVFAHFAAGQLNLTITNEMEVDLENITLNLRNSIDASLVFTTNIPLIEANSVENVIIPLADKDLYKDLQFEMETFESPGSGPDPFNQSTWVFIDLDDAITFEFTTQDLLVSSGEAVVSNSTFISDIAVIDMTVEDGYRLSRINFDETSIEYIINSDIQAEILLRISFIKTTNISSGEIIVKEIPISYTAGNPIIGYIDLSNTTTDLADPYNIFPIKYEMEMDLNGQAIAFNSTDEVSVEMNLGNIDFSLIEGYFGKTNFDFEAGSIDFNIDFFDQLEGGFTLADPKLNITYSNSIGLPIALKLNFVGTAKDGTTQALNYVNSQGNDTIYFDYPVSIGGLIEDQITISKESSDIVELMALPPTNIEYSGVVISNTFGDGTENFVTDSSKIIMGVEMDIPFSLMADNLRFQDTLDLNLGESLGDEFEYVELKMITHNGFPFDMNLSLILIDTVNSINIDTIVFSDIITSAAVDDEGKVSESTKSIVDLLLNEEVINNLKLANKTIIKAGISTFNQGQTPVKLYSNYKFKIAIGLEAKLNIKID